LSKIRTLLTGLKHTQEALELIEGTGIDVNRLIGISNAQGPIAEMIRGVLLGSIELSDPAISRAVSPLLPKRIPDKTGSSTKKRSRKTPSST
jgi:hypothetical protein